MLCSLNAVREMCSRCPLVMNEDLLQDLTQYKTHRERSVMMAARSLIQLYRHTMPSLLHKKDRVIKSFINLTIFFNPQLFLSQLIGRSCSFFRLDLQSIYPAVQPLELFKMFSTNLLMILYYCISGFLLEVIFYRSKLICFYNIEF